jgi:uncharacterized protein
MYYDRQIARDEMRLEHEFTVAAPPDRTWNALAGADAVAACLPGAQLRPIDGLQTGRIELDPDRGISCDVTVSTIDRDDDEHVSTVALRGREPYGPGIGSAILRSQLAPAAGETTRVVLSADVNSTGHRPAEEFEDRAQSLLAALGDALQRRALEAPTLTAQASRAAGPSEAPAFPTAQTTPASPESTGGRPKAAKLAVATAAGAVITVVVLRRRRSGR